MDHGSTAARGGMGCVVRWDMRKLIAPVAALLCGAALHCNMGTGPGPAGNPDLGPGPGGGDGGMTQGALTGTQIDTVITEAGEAPQPHDLSGEQIAALVP